MAPIEQKDGTEQDRASKPGEITHSIPRRGEINNGFVFERELDRQIAGVCPSQNLINV
jgi:hypothetical protein